VHSDVWQVYVSTRLYGVTFYTTVIVSFTAAKNPDVGNVEVVSVVCPRKSLSLSRSLSLSLYIYIYKGKAILLQAWTGPEDSRRLRLPDFKTIDT
jgi:hypothetical protein